MAEERFGNPKHSDREAEATKRPLSEDYGGIFICTLGTGLVLLALLSLIFVGATYCVAFFLPFSGWARSPIYRLALLFHASAVAALADTTIARFVARLMAEGLIGEMYLNRTCVGGSSILFFITPAQLILAAQVSFLRWVKLHDNDIGWAHEEAVFRPRRDEPRTWEPAHHLRKHKLRNVASHAVVESSF